MSQNGLALIFFFYGLAFFSMGLVILLEMGHGSDARLRHALRPLAFFGLVHGGHEWMEMLVLLGLVPIHQDEPLGFEALRVGVLALSFLALGAFGSSLLAPGEGARRWSLAVQIGQVSAWGIGLLAWAQRFPVAGDLWAVADVWTRYTLAVPSALLAFAGLLAQQRAFRRAGLIRFGRDSLWAAVAFAVYGLVGQVFTRSSPLPPSTVLNSALFLAWFGFPIQLLRASAAVVVAVSVTRFVRSREVEMQTALESLQAARLHEAQRREALRGELLKRVVAAQEAERQRIARELHDETGQALTAIGLGLRGASSVLRQDPDRAAGNLRQLEGLVARSLVELQRLIADLRPSHLDDLGLPAALRWYAGEIQTRAPLTVSVETEGEPRALQPEVNTTLFRVAQEALTNVVKHADARHVTVRLRYEGESVRLEVDDDGRGFDLQAASLAAGAPSWGLAGMQERASLLGGALTVETSPGAGTRIEVRLPYHAAPGGTHEYSALAR